MQIQPGLIPRYYQLKEILEGRIESGEFQVGKQVPDRRRIVCGI
jgi:DNA-binding GntR family transcriptional regulator